MFVTQNEQRTIPDYNQFMLVTGRWGEANKVIDSRPECRRNSHFVSNYGIKRRAMGATLSVNLKILTHTDT